MGAKKRRKKEMVGRNVRIKNDPLFGGKAVLSRQHRMSRQHRTNAHLLIQFGEKCAVGLDDVLRTSKNKRKK
jgi:hypothetical protein